MLVVIDMQEEFAVSAKKVIEPCYEEILNAKRRREHIAQVEYSMCGWTYAKIDDAIAYYSKRILVTKNCNSAAANLKRAIARRKLPIPRHFRICGVNTNWCVRATIEDLARTYPKSKISLLSHACFDRTPHEHDLGIKSIQRVPNVTII